MRSDIARFPPPTVIHITTPAQEPGGGSRSTIVPPPVFLPCIRSDRPGQAERFSFSMKSLAATGRSSTELVELFADREQLTGKARERFRALLQETLIPAMARSGAHWKTWSLLSAAFVPAAIFAFRFAEGRFPPGWFTLGCLAYGCIGIAFALGFRRAREISRANVEVNWATYCSVFRPALIELLPGLLDRNLAADTRERMTTAPKRARSLTELWRDRDEEFWSSSLCGLGLGVVAMTVTAIQHSDSPAVLLIPVPVAIVTVTAWISWNRRVMRRQSPPHGEAGL